MKFTSALTLVLASVATTVSAAPRETNGDRLARGLPPLPPVRRSGTPAYAAKRQSPSGTPSQCNTGSAQCCNSVGSASDGPISALLGLLGIDIGSITGLVGVTCSPLSVIGVGGNSCTAQPVCCENNTFNGVVAIGCTPININL